MRWSVINLPRRSFLATLGSRSALPKILMVFAAITLGVVSAGACPVQFMQHGIGSWFEHCPDSLPSLSHAFLLSNPAGVNTGAVDIVCRELNSQTSQYIPCQPEAGVLGDGRVTIQFDWGGINTGFVGCPNPAGTTNGSARLHIHTVSQDGQSILTSISYSVDVASYFVDFAHPYTDTFVPLACDEPGRRILRVDAANSSGGNLAVDLTVFAPRISTDCDPGSTGELIGLCTGASPIATISTGRVYMQRGFCEPGSGNSRLPVHDLRLPAWTFLSDSDAQGHASVSFPAPGPTECVYLGATYRYDNQESPAIGGFVRIPFAGCVDADGDGISTCEPDCDDNDPRAYQGNTEVCDGIDNDCDGQTDEDLGVITCGRGRCTRSVPACVDGVEQVCTPPGPPSKQHGLYSEMCGPPGIGVVPVP